MFVQHLSDMRATGDLIFLYFSFWLPDGCYIFSCQVHMTVESVRKKHGLHQQDYHVPRETGETRHVAPQPELQHGSSQLEQGFRERGLGIGGITGKLPHMAPYSHCLIFMSLCNLFLFSVCGPCESLLMEKQWESY